MNTGRWSENPPWKLLPTKVRKQRITLILPLLLDEVGGFEDIAVEFGLFVRVLDEFQFAGGAGSEVLRNDDIVEEVPCVAVGERSQTGFEHVGEGRVEIARLQLLDLGLGAQMDFDALVGRIVVEVAHGHDLGGGVDFEHRVGDRTHLFGRGVALERPMPPVRPAARASARP